MCKAPLFYYTKTYDQQPITDCRDALVSEATGGLLAVGYITFITGIISIIAFCGSFPLCGAFNKEDEPSDSKVNPQ